MKELTAEQIEANWNEFMSNIDTHITGERKEKLKAFYEKYADRIITMPASAVDHYHSTWPGGYVEHVNRVVKMALATAELWTQFGSPLNFEIEELVFAAINHDLGKMGSVEEEYYIPNPSDWHRKNQGKIYEHNNKCSKMPVPDRSILLLAQHGVTFNETEFIGIKIHDGMYDDANKPYYLGYGPGQKLKTALPYVLHQADMAAARIEFEEWRDNYSGMTTPSAPAKKVTDPIADKEVVKSANKLFDDLFPSK